MLKIAVDSGPLFSDHGVRGIGTYVRELTKVLKNVDVVDFSKYPDKFPPGYEVVHFTSFKPFEVSTPSLKPKGVKFIITIYDLIPLIYPKHYPPGVRGWLNWQRNKILIKKNIDAIITISETSKKDICRFTGINPNKVYVTYLAARPIFKKLANPKFPGIPKKFALYVGDINYNKNIANLVKACEIAKIPLFIAGKQAREVDSMNLDHPELKHLKGINWSNVIRPGFISDEELVNIYNLANVYIQPSFYEGFGLPLLEAIKSKTPVAVSKNQCHVEILGADFEYFDPKDPQAIADSILHPNINKRIPREYSWEKTAKETQEIYAKI